MLLLAIFAVPVIAAVVIFRYAIDFLELAVETYLPGFDHRSWFHLVLYGALSLWSMRRGIGSLRSRLWRNAFLSFAIVPMMMSFAVSHPLISDGVLFASPWWLILYTSTDSVLSRLELLLGGFVICLTVAANTGLLGAGTAAQVATYSVYMAMWVLFAIYLRREQKQNQQNESIALVC